METLDKARLMEDASAVPNRASAIIANLRGLYRLVSILCLLISLRPGPEIPQAVAR